ncbi:hypothetical protein BDZ85DRAFT_268806 [Elsinoe ampelina]|uniref:Uncharacterized protein n=1 Tax=Elsinoe ampelina TaxID=302913 RepID=A0A6A6G116_9PEZI|nr:hypothetical protein BDZ85DRAFT_268806 [Elsinoe ampelina]
MSARKTQPHLPLQTIITNLLATNSFPEARRSKAMGTATLILVYYKGEYKIAKYCQWDVICSRSTPC